MAFNIKEIITATMILFAIIDIIGNIPIIIGLREKVGHIQSEKGLASIPVSVFNKEQPDDGLLRFCFAKEEDTLLKAAAILNAI